MGRVVLYDLPSKQGCSWSLNPWKTRLALNFKQIPYETKWVEYPDLKKTLSALGIPPNSEGMEYTSPAVTFNDGSHMQNSRMIADRLEKDQPDPSMHLDAPILKEVEATMPKIMDALAPLMLPNVPRNILPERQVVLGRPESSSLRVRSAEYFRETRAKRFGMHLEELEKSDRGGENAWTNLRVPIGEIAQLLKREDGPFFLASGISYADFYIAGLWRCLERSDEKLLQRMLSMDLAFGEHYKACAPWLAKED